MYGIITCKRIVSRDTIDYVGPVTWRGNRAERVDFAGGYATIGAGGRAEWHYYTADHLGNNRVVTSGTDGTVEQLLHYYPFGGTYTDAGIGIHRQQLKREGKELDPSYGLNWYDYHARPYAADLPFWFNPDPLADKYPHLSPYAYCANNPQNCIDPDGEFILMTNGYLFFNQKGGETYWGGKEAPFVKAAIKSFNDSNVFFTDIDHDLGTAQSRIENGYQYAKNNLASWKKTMKPGESFKLIGHSMGCAFNKGVEMYLKEHGESVEYNIMFNAFQVDKISNEADYSTIHLDVSSPNDAVLKYFDGNHGQKKLENADNVIRINSQDSGRKTHSTLIESGATWELIWKHERLRKLLNSR